MPTTLATTPAATKLQVSPNTLRNWSEQYSDFLSPSARPGAQPERRFTEKDLTVLTYIKQLRSEGMEKPQIVDRLKETTFQDVEVLKLEPTALQEATATTLQPASPDSPGALILPSVALDDLQKRFEALERSVSDNRQSQRDFVVGLALGALGMGLFMILLLLLFLVRHYL